MTPREIIAEAWTITKREPALRRWGFTSSFFETLLNVKLLIYQVYFIVEMVRGHQAGFFDVEIWLYHNTPPIVFWGSIITFCVLVVLEIFIPHLCRGAVIGLAAKSFQGEPVRGGLVLALYNFFALFAVHEFFLLSGVPTLITTTSLILRYIESPIKEASIGMLVFLFVMSNILKFCASFADSAIVVRKKGIFEALGQSFKLVVSHLNKIVFLMLLLFVISIRILINAIMILLIPAIVTGLALLLTLILSPAISYSIAGIVGMAMIIAASYFFAYLYVFKQAVWTLTYIQLSQHKELDVILEE